MFTPIGASQDTLDDLVERYTNLLAPKPGRRRDKALAEIDRQRGEKLDRITKLRLEAAALFIVSQNVSQG
jgi:hypothetical protein